MDDAEKDAFMATFYERYMPWLVEPLYDVRVAAPGGAERAAADATPAPGARVANAGACAHVCELLAPPRKKLSFSLYLSPLSLLSLSSLYHLSPLSLPSLSLSL